MVSKEKVKKKKQNFFFLKNGHGIGKRVAIFNWQFGRNLAPRDGQKMRDKPDTLYLIRNFK